MASAKKQALKEGEEVAGRYRIEGVVGRGGFGAVYKAMDLTNGARVALKVLIANYSTSKIDRKRFERESGLLQKLHHPNVVRVTDFGTTEKNAPYIAFELLHGQSLKDKLEADGAISLQRTAQITIDLLDGLRAAHKMGIVHRDMKPQNIFICGDASKTTKILDFGIAKLENAEEGETHGTQLTEAGQMIGTPHYMAPEQVRGLAVDRTIDLYAVGLIMAEMLTGERVVKANTLIDIYMAHVNDDPLKFGQQVLDSPLLGVIERATEKEIGKRFPSAKAMRDAIQHAVGSGEDRASAAATLLMPSRAAAEFMAGVGAGGGVGGTIVMPEVDADMFALAATPLAGTVADPSSQDAMAASQRARQAIAEAGASEARTTEFRAANPRADIVSGHSALDAMPASSRGDAHVFTSAGQQSPLHAAHQAPQSTPVPSSDGFNAQGPPSAPQSRPGIHARPSLTPEIAAQVMDEPSDIINSPSALMALPMPHPGQVGHAAAAPASAAVHTPAHAAAQAPQIPTPPGSSPGAPPSGDRISHLVPPPPASTSRRRKSGPSGLTIAAIALVVVGCAVAAFFVFTR